ncbi:MAG: hypothetical protein GY749_40380 [Desulfobacteraceae bacterium]|nr:hypothetical protein [Desulfobacteraceae bacterium]
MTKTVGWVHGELSEYFLQQDIHASASSVTGKNPPFIAVRTVGYLR